MKRFINVNEIFHWCYCNNTNCIIYWYETIEKSEHFKMAFVTFHRSAKETLLTFQDFPAKALGMVKFYYKQK